MPEKSKTPTQGSVQVAKSLKNYFMFFVPPLTDMESFHMPTTTVAHPVKHQNYENGTAIKYRHPRLPEVHKSDDMFINYGTEVASFLKRSFDGVVHFIPLDSDIK